MKKVRLELNRIPLDSEIQPRVELDDSHIEDLKNDLMEGAVFPPVVVFYDDSDYWLAEGFHRWLAHERAGRSEIDAEIREGGKRDAQLYAVGSNATHGKRRTNADKRRAVATLLRDAEWGEWSDRHIAKVCRVSQPLVSDVRNELTESGFQFPATRKCSDGREMNVSQIGCNSAQESQLAPAEAGQNPESGHPPTETSEVANTGNETAQANVSEPAGRSQADTSVSSAPEAGGQPEDIAGSVEPESDEKSKEEAVAASEEASTGEIHEAAAQESQARAPEAVDDIPTLKAKVVALEEALSAKDLELRNKDKIIEDLKTTVWSLEQDNAYWLREFDRLDEMDKRRCKANWDGCQPSGRPMVLV